MGCTAWIISIEKSNPSNAAPYRFFSSTLVQEEVTLTRSTSTCLFSNYASLCIYRRTGSKLTEGPIHKKFLCVCGIEDIPLDLRSTFPRHRLTARAAYVFVRIFNTT